MFLGIEAESALEPLVRHLRPVVAVPRYRPFLEISTKLKVLGHLKVCVVCVSGLVFV